MQRLSAQSPIPFRPTHTLTIHTHTHTHAHTPTFEEVDVVSSLASREMEAGQAQALAMGRGLKALYKGSGSQVQWPVST